MDTKTVKPRKVRFDIVSEKQQIARDYRQHLGGILMSAQMLKMNIRKFAPHYEKMLDIAIFRTLQELERKTKEAGVKISTHYSDKFKEVYHG